MVITSRTGRRVEEALASRGVGMPGTHHAARCAFAHERMGAKHAMRFGVFTGEQARCVRRVRG